MAIFISSKMNLTSRLPIVFLFSIFCLLFGNSKVNAQTTIEDTPKTNLELSQPASSNLTLKYPLSKKDSLQETQTTILPTFESSVQAVTKWNPKPATKSSSYALKAKNLVNQLGGTIAIVDENNNPLLTHKPNAMLEPASTWKLATALGVFTYFPVSNKKNSVFADRNTFTIVKFVLDHSDNGWADRLASKVKLPRLEALIQKVTNNNKIHAANGSGCPRGLAGDGCDYYSGREPIYMSANDSIAILDSLNLTLEQQNLKLESLIGNVNKPGSTAYNRFHEDFADVPYAQVYGKTGSINNSLTFSGFMYNRYGQKIKYAFFNTGSHNSVGNKQGALLRSLWMSSAQELVEVSGRQLSSK